MIGRQIAIIGDLAHDRFIGIIIVIIGIVANIEKTILAVAEGLMNLKI
jgi:hypothetical protein